jgi:hypothetical protein
MLLGFCSTVLLIRIRDLVPFRPLDPGWVKNQERVRDEQPGDISESLETLFGLKYLNSLMRIRDPALTSRIRITGFLFGL